MITKKDVLILAQLLDQDGIIKRLKIEDQTVFSKNHPDRLFKCLNKLETYGIITIKGEVIMLKDLDGLLISAKLIGFGLKKGDKDFKGKEELALL